MNEELNLCKQYCSLVKDIDKSPYLNYGLDIQRSLLHMQILEIYGVDGYQIQHITDNLDLIDYNPKRMDKEIMKVVNK